MKRIYVQIILKNFFLDFVGQSLNNKAKIGLTIETLK